MITILCSNKDDFMFKHLSSNVDTFYKIGLVNAPIKSKITKTIAIFLSIFHLQFLLYGKWKRFIKGNKFIVTDDVGLHLDVVKYINRYKDNFTVFLCNPVKTVSGKSNLNKLKCKVITFDNGDAKKYNLIHYHYFCPYLPEKVPSQNKYNLMFVGFDKGRREKVERIVKATQLNNNYIKIITGTIFALSYEEYLKILFASKAIIEIVQDGQEGITLRTIESLYYKKKLITNNIGIRKLPFYNPNNIFVVEDFKKINANDLKHFLESNYCKIDDVFFNEYKPNEWLNKIERIGFFNI